MKTLLIGPVLLAILSCAACSPGESDPAAPAAKRTARAAAEPASATGAATPSPVPASAPAPPPAASPVAAAAPAPPSAQPAPGVELVEREGVALSMLVIARGVEKRQPVEPGTAFGLAAGEKLYAVMDVRNPSKTESELSVAWLPEGGDTERGAVTLTVGAQPRWRTWAYHSGFRKPGRWTAIVRDAGGEEIGRATFDVTE